MDYFANYFELNDLLVGCNFFYNQKYIGVIKNIEYEYGSDYYMLYFYDNSKPCPLSKKSMKDCYMDRLKNIRMNLLASRRIMELVHFTPIANLETILEQGIRSRFDLDSDTFNNGFSFIASDPYRLDNKRDFVCNSITFPNYKMFFPKRQENLSVKWAVLRIDSHILIDKFDTEFYRMNAACSTSSKCRFAACSNDALEDMFYPEDREPNLDSNYTTNPQAEVMIKDLVEPSYIRCIDTEYFNDKAYSLARNSGILYNDRSNLFGPRKDYRRW